MRFGAGSEDFDLFRSTHMLSASTLALAFVLAQDVPSGPPAGEKLGEFKAHAYSGPDAGKEFKVIEKAKDGPALLIFLHAADAENGIKRGALQFLRPVDKYAAEHDKLAAHIIWVSGDKDKTQDFLKRAENSLALQSPISICLDGAKDKKVVANFALTEPSPDDSKKVIAAIAKVLGKDPPKEEKKEETKAKYSAELQKLMRKMINKNNSEQDVKDIADEMKKWAGTDEKKLAEMRDYAKLVAGLGYGTEHAQAALKKLAEK